MAEAEFGIAIAAAIYAYAATSARLNVTGALSATGATLMMMMDTRMDLETIAMQIFRKEVGDNPAAMKKALLIVADYKEDEQFLVYLIAVLDEPETKDDGHAT